MMMLAISALLVMQQASDVRIIPAMPGPPPTAETLTASAFEYDCEFDADDGRKARVVLQRLGGRGYEVSASEYPVRRTPFEAVVVLNETSARIEAFSEVLAQGTSSELTLRTYETSGPPALLRIEDDWSYPDTELDKRASAKLHWGKIVDDGNSRWYENSMTGSCALKESQQRPLSEPETQEFLAQ